MNNHRIHPKSQWAIIIVVLFLGFLTQQADAQSGQFGGGQFGQFGGGQFGQVGGGQVGQIGGGQFGGGGGNAGFNFGGSQNASAFAGSFNGQQGFVVVSSANQRNVLAIDTAAISSCIISGVPMALSQRELLLHAARTGTGDVNARLFRLRAQSEAVVAPPISPVPTSSGKQPDQPLAAAPSEFLSDDKRFTLFGGASFGSAQLDWRGISSAFDAETFTGTIGAEIRLTDHFVLGLAGTYLETNGDFDTRGSVDADGFALSGYLSFTQGNFYADALYSFTNLNEDIHRRTGLGSIAHADPGSAIHSIEFNTGYNFGFGGLRTGPILGLDYRNGQLDGYTEHGDSRARLGYDEQSFDSLVTRVGWQASYRISTQFGSACHWRSLPTIGSLGAKELRTIPCGPAPPAQAKTISTSVGGSTSGLERIFRSSSITKGMFSAATLSRILHRSLLRSAIRKDVV